MNREFLKEAIADAKAVKESAIANAKAALEESFTPQLKTMLAAKLEEMDKKDEEVKEEMSDPVMRKGLKGDNAEELETEKMRKIKEEDSSDLDEVLAELENELKEDARTDAEEEGYKDGMKDEKEDLKEDERTDAEEEGYLDGEKDEKEDMDDEDVDLDDMSDDDLKVFIEDVISDMVEAGELEAGGDPVEKVEVEDEVEVEDDVEVTDEESVDVDVALDEDKRTDAEEEGYKDGIEDAKADMEKKIKDIKEGSIELEEAYATIKTLRSELNEINILNAKLLYSNKIFKAKNLTEAQKVKVLGACDKAENVKEVKLVYETLSEGIKAKKRTAVNENVNLGRASKTVIGKSKASKKPIVESNEMVDRFKKLAGII
jgi:hypothetical protein